MGSGAWTTTSFVNYSASKGRSITADSVVDTSFVRSAQDMYSMIDLAADMNPLDIVRECRDTEEHPRTVPVILALDVTGSMGGAAVEVASKLGKIMQDVMETKSDVEFCIMGIGDLAYDKAPIQMSQFESDIRIAEHLDKVFFEAGGGGNDYESYTAAWYMGLYHTDLDCWKRGEKGIIITIGDEPLNPYLPVAPLRRVTGDNQFGAEMQTETQNLYDAVTEKFDVYHIAVDDAQTAYKYYKNFIDMTFGRILGEHLIVAKMDEIHDAIVSCIGTTSKGDVSW